MDEYSNIRPCFFMSYIIPRNRFMYNTYIISIKRAGFNVRSHVDARKIVKKHNGDNTNIKSECYNSNFFPKLLAIKIEFTIKYIQELFFATF